MAVECTNDRTYPFNINMFFIIKADKTLQKTLKIVTYLPSQSMDTSILV